VFQLTNPPPAPKKLGGHNKTGKQLRFISADSGCLPGQLDLFEQDGMPEHSEPVLCECCDEPASINFPGRLCEHHGRLRQKGS